jgi:hypothetical protein
VIPRVSGVVLASSVLRSWSSFLVSCALYSPVSGGYSLPVTRATEPDSSPAHSTRSSPHPESPLFGSRRGRRRRMRSPNAGFGHCVTSCWTGPSSGTRPNSDVSFASTSSTTTRIGHTARCTNGHLTTLGKSSRSARPPDPTKHRLRRAHQRVPHRSLKHPVSASRTAREHQLLRAHNAGPDRWSHLKWTTRDTR